RMIRLAPTSILFPYTTLFRSTPHLIFYLFKIKVVDQPDERKIHAEAVPRMGGIITYALLIFSLTIYYQNLNEIRFLVLGSVIIRSEEHTSELQSRENIVCRLL